MTVYYYNLIVDPSFQAELVDMAEFTENLEAFLQGKNPLVEGIIDETYEKLATQIKDSTKFEFLPVETLRETDGREILYTARGYPMGSKKRAITHRTSKYYSFIQIDVWMRSGNSTNAKLGSFQSEKMKIRPSVRIDMKVFDEQGNRVGKYNVVAKTKEEIVVQTKLVFNWFKVGDDRRLEDEDNQQILDNLIDEAIATLVDDMLTDERMARLETW